VPPASGEVSLPDRVAEQRTHDERRLLEILQGLEQRHDVEAVLEPSFTR